MEIKQEGNDWFAKKSKKAKRWERVTDIIKFDGDLCSVMGRAGMTDFHAYLGRDGDRWLEMYGVTSLLNYWGEKENLIQWAVTQAIECIQSHPLLTNPLVRPEYVVELLPLVLEEARKAHLTNLKTAGDHGTKMHSAVEEWIEIRLAGTIMDATEHHQLQDFIHWAEPVTFLASEKPLYSRRLWVAGTTDFICEIEGKKFIGDLKTSRYASFKHFLQCGAYALMYEEMGLGKIDGIVIAHMPRDGGFNVLMDIEVEKYKRGFEMIVELARMDKDKSYSLGFGK